MVEYFGSRVFEAHKLLIQTVEDKHAAQSLTEDTQENSANKHGNEHNDDSTDG